MKKKNNWTCLLLILTGIVLGGFIGSLFDNSWLNYGQTFGLTNPVTLDLGILVITFGLTIRITIASIIRAIQNRHRADWEGEQKEERQEPASVLVILVMILRCQHSLTLSLLILLITMRMLNILRQKLFIKNTQLMVL